MVESRPPFLIWIKRKVASLANRDVVNLASSGVKTELADGWFSAVLADHAAEITRRSAESHQFGLASLKQAIRAAFGVPEHREIVLTAGASGGMRLVFEALLAGRPDADVLVEAPIYQPLRAIPRRLGAKIVPFEREPQLNLEAIARLVSSRAAAIVLTNLHNPTGQLLDDDSLRDICRMLDAAGSRAPIVVDETFLDLGPRSGTTAATLDPRIITICSLSKSHGLPTLRCGWVTVDPAAFPRFLDDAVLFQNIGFQLAEILGAMAVEQLDEFRTAARHHVTRNRAVVARWLNEMAAAGAIEPLAAPPSCIAFPRTRSGRSTMALAEELETRFGVLAVPGQFFGDAYDQHIRIGFGGDHESLQRGLARLAEGLVARTVT
jgi:aspartate/methionine/tyrosine aminotransferase